MAPWALSRNKDTYGEDADLFRPERWLDEKRAREYERYDAFFGGGTWLCLGKLVPLNIVSMKYTDSRIPLKKYRISRNIQDHR